MLPLRATETVKNFPRLVAALIGLLLAAHFFSYIGGDSSRVAYLTELGVDRESYKSLGSFLVSLLFHENFFALWISCIYVWSFGPKLFESRNGAYVLGASVVCAWFSTFLYFKYHGDLALAPLLLSQVWLSAVLGMAMRWEIWRSVSTLVFGPKIFQVFEVPSYVLLFFWFFYLMLGNLFMSPTFSNAPTLYFLPLLAFVSGFLLETLVAFVMKKFWKSSTPDAHEGAGAESDGKRYW